MKEARLLAVVPDIGRQLPVISDLLPHHEIFAGDFLRGAPSHNAVWCDG
jgi:hypothetical protein